MEKDIQKDNPIEVIQKRFNNIVAALYLVTNHLSDMEPLKTGMRETAHIVLEELLEVSDISSTFIDSRLGHIRNLLKIASIANLISGQNFSLLDNELSSTQTYLQDMYKRNSNIAFDISEILSINNSVNNSAITPPNNYPKSSFSNPITNTINRPNHATNPVNGANPKNRPSIYISQRSANTVDKPPQTQPVRKDPIRDGFSPRQAQIIKEIKLIGQLTIRDLIGKIEGCSEKTIQRELLALVEGGVLKKEGERRWSRYSML